MKKEELEQKVELLEKVVLALCRGKSDYVSDEWKDTGEGYAIRGLVNVFEEEMKNLDFNYKRNG